MTPEEVHEQVLKPTDGEDAEKKDAMGMMLKVMLFAGRATNCPACPVFINRLRQGPELSNLIKQIMRER
jgi:hypothetical protein